MRTSCCAGRVFCDFAGEKGRKNIGFNRPASSFRSTPPVGAGPIACAEWRVIAALTAAAELTCGSKSHSPFGISKTAGDLLRIVFRSVLGTMGAGIFAGVALSLTLNQIIAKWARGNPRDPVIILAGTVLLGLVSGLACAIPARRASKIDPIIALRSE